MKTNFTMKRQFMWCEIHQQKDMMFCATDLLQLHNSNPKNTSRSISWFFENKDVQEYLNALSSKLDRDKPWIKVGNSELKEVGLVTDLYKIGRGRWSKTRMHPYLFVKFAMWLNKEFEVEVMAWIADNLISFRDSAGDHYREMCSVMQTKHIERNWNKPDPLMFIKESHFINELAWVWCWERDNLPEDKLELINKLQVANIKFMNKWMSKNERWSKLRDVSFALT